MRFGQQKKKKDKKNDNFYKKIISKKNKKEKKAHDDIFNGSDHFIQNAAVFQMKLTFCFFFGGGGGIVASTSSSEYIKFSVYITLLVCTYIYVYVCVEICVYSEETSHSKSPLCSSSSRVIVWRHSLVLAFFN